MTLKSIRSTFEDYYLSLAARYTWLWHRVRHPRHEMEWRTNDDSSCAGDMTCLTCNSLYWCRAHDPWYKSQLGQWYCGRKYGHFHSSSGNWTQSSGEFDADGESVMVPMPDPDPAFCMRCNKSLPPLFAHKAA